MNDLEKWRLILGKFSRENLDMSLGSKESAIEELLDSVYDREYAKEKGMYGKESSGFVVLKNLKKVQGILEQTTVNKIATDAFSTYDMYDILADDQYLQNAKADMELLQNLIMYKEYTKKEERSKIRYKIRQVANEIKKELMTQIDIASRGSTHKIQSTKYKKSKSIDIKKTIEKNMKNYDIKGKKLYVEDIYFYPNMAKSKPRDVLLIVDCSGSMMASLIYVAIVASIFYNVPDIDIKIILFDTRIVDISDAKTDPIDLLLDVQLGGGTNVARALEYSKKLIKRPEKTLCITITDLFSEEVPMLRAFEDIKNTGAKTIVFTGIEEDAKAYYNGNFAAKLEQIGIPVESVTVKELANYIKGKV